MRWLSYSIWYSSYCMVEEVKVDFTKAFTRKLRLESTFTFYTIQYERFSFSGDSRFTPRPCPSVKRWITLKLKRPMVSSANMFIKKWILKDFLWNNLKTWNCTAFSLWTRSYRRESAGVFRCEPYLCEFHCCYIPLSKSQGFDIDRITYSHWNGEYVMTLLDHSIVSTKSISVYSSPSSWTQWSVSNDIEFEFIMTVPLCWWLCLSIETGTMCEFVSLSKHTQSVSGWAFPMEPQCAFKRWGQTSNMTLSVISSSFHRFPSILTSSTPSDRHFHRCTDSTPSFVAIFWSTKLSETDSVHLPQCGAVYCVFDVIALWICCIDITVQYSHCHIDGLQFQVTSIVSHTVVTLQIFGILKNCKRFWFWISIISLPDSMWLIVSVHSNRYRARICELIESVIKDWTQWLHIVCIRSGHLQNDPIFHWPISIHFESMDSIKCPLHCIGKIESFSVKSLPDFVLIDFCNFCLSLRAVVIVSVHSIRYEFANLRSVPITGHCVGFQW